MTRPLSNDESDSKTWAKLALKIALTYLVLSLSWIWLVDGLSAAMISNPDALARLQVVKSWSYVGFTCLLIYVLMRNSLNARWQAENTLWERSRELALAHQLSQDLNSTLESEEVIAKVLQEISQTLHVVACSIWLVDNDTYEMVCHKAVNPKDISIQGWRLLPGQGIVGWATTHGQSAIVPDAQTDERHFSGIDQKIGVEIRSVLAVPLVFKKHAIGAIELVHTKKDYFKTTDLVFVEFLAASTVSAIKNAKLYSQLRVYTTELEKRVAERTQELTLANERLQELDRLKSKFVSDVTHELRAPITNLLLNTALLENGKAEKREHYIAVIQNQASRLQQLVDDTLSLSRMEMAKTIVQSYSAVNLNQLVEQVVTAHMQKAEVEDLGLVFAPCVDLPPVKGNHNQLAQLATNLINNSLNYTAVGWVQVQTQLDMDRNQVCLAVEDTGLGIEPNDLPHLFERFYRGNLIGQSNIPGTGLGLAIVKEIVDLHNGHIEVDSEVGVGSTFRVWLPTVG